MRKNYLFRVAMCLGICAMLSLCMTAGTYAKYTATVSANPDKARVAKFDFQLSDKKLSDNANATIDLFNTVYDTAGTTDDGKIDNAASASDPAIIAPGSWGYVAVTVTNLSEVSIQNTFTFVESQKKGAGALDIDIPIQYAVATAEPAKASDIVTANWVASTAIAGKLDTAFSSALNIAGTTGDSKTVYIAWKWDFEQTPIADNNDTSLGKYALSSSTEPTVSVTITCTATQVD